ncbi:hypothetical protein ACLS0M_06360 [Avibacterium avium]
MEDRYKQQKSTQFGFSFRRRSVHNARTMMLEELSQLFAYLPPEAQQSDYAHAIDEENILGKRSSKTRVLTYRHLVDLYALDNDVLLFHALRYFWQRDSEGRPLLALLCTFARDSVFRSTAPFLLPIPEGETVSRQALEDFIDALEPARFSAGTLKSTAQNINSTWTQSGHLSGRARKIRRRAQPTAGSVAYALFLGYLTGNRGQGLFQTEYMKLLDCSAEQALDLAESAAYKGWIVLKKVGNIIEIGFPNLISPEKMEWLREQN